MTEDSQDVDLSVVTPPLPALPVCPEPNVRTTTISDCAQPALHVAENSSSIPCTSALHSCANVTLDPNNTGQVLESLLQNKSTLCDHENVKLLDGKEEVPVVSTQSTDNYPIFDSVAESEGNLSVSTDETLQYSDSDSPVHVIKGLSNKDDMGNQTSNKKSAPSDEDTPDEAKTKCCEIPKKKFKDRLSKASRSSKSGEDFDFEDDELYPFEGRTRSEREIVDPVELEPFEIIETDDIKFIPGAGTSDVIKSASESKFKTIPEEGSVDGDEKFDTFIIKHDDTLEHEPIVIDKNDGVGEPGTSTTTSTFEFKPAKSKAKTAKQKQKNDTAEPTYANVQLASGGSRGTSRQNSNSSSNDISRKNSKEGIKKPVRKNSKKISENIKEKIEKESKNETSKSLEVSDPKDTAQAGPFVLKQTMFSTPNPQEVGVKAKVMNEDKNVSQNSYENVNVGVMFGPQGITICNTKPITTPTTPAKNKENIDQIPNTTENTVDCIGTPSVPGTSDTATIGRPESPLYETLLTEGKDRVADKDSTQETQDGIEAVPPSSPLVLEVLEEEEEDDELLDEDEMDEDDLIEEENKRKSAIIEFTETVCKRLSQLLDDQPEERGEDDNDKQAGPIEHIYETVRKDDLYSVPKAKECAGKTSDEIEINKTNSSPEKYKMNVKPETKTITTPDITTKTESDERLDIKPEKYLDKKMEDDANIEKENNTEKPSIVTCNESSQQESSSATLTQTSGDSVKHTLPDAQCSSDDDLPDYFDPTNVPPKRDSEILCDVLDAYSEDGITAVSAKEVADIVDANTLDFVQHIQGHSTTKADKSLALPLQGFDESLVRRSPNTNSADELQDRTPVAEVQPELTPLQELASASEDVPVQYDTSGRQSESDLDISEQRDDLSTDSMLADDEDEETMEILFTKTYTEPVEGGEVFLSCTVVNSAYKEEQKKSETWLSDEALEYFEANAADVMSTAFMKARKEMKDIQVCLASLRKQMEHFHDDYDDISLPDIPVDAMSPCDYYGLPRKAVTD